MPDETALLIMGLGTARDGDGGLGAAVLDRLRRDWIAPPAVRLASADPPGDVARVRAALVVDAVPADMPAGAFVRLRGEEVPAGVLERCPEAIAALGRDEHRGEGSELIVVGLVPETYAPGCGLSARVASGLQGLVRHVVLEARRLGHDFRLRHPAKRATQTL